MSENKRDTKAAWVDPDDVPELTDEWFDDADVHDNGVLIRRGRGRPKVATPKQQITLRLDADIIERFRATGPGWQARINEALRKAG
ncbi:hypothetical protein IP69_07665 [Bosea sp. AAP35]|uniref:BrnA antitoxin family protein n=1 Tax=Bosea sp. AAP35 TaxID=1523417 RepID=UPI0006B88A4F|nr:BrnA antitoxin family protein [Bosea sp. AAP35]KPF71169.1 hypothetical protein IP69_07665 [Bosea sp. AAP35]